MDISKKSNGRWTATQKGTLNGVHYTFFAQSSSLLKAIKTVKESFEQFKQHVKQFEDWDMNKSESIAELSAALAKAQGEFAAIPKNRAVKIQMK